MSKYHLMIPNVVVRILALFNISYLIYAFICAKYFPRLDHVNANSFVGLVILFGVAATCILLPVYVGFEFWKTRRLNNMGPTNAWILNGLLAAISFALFLGLCYYGLTHYMML
jgi:hypothetical protein